MYHFIIFLLILYWIGKRILRTKKIPTIHDKYVFITGCDSGFGHLLAKRLDYLGANVFAGCLTEDGRDKLDKVTSHRVTPLLINVLEEESIAKALAFVKSRLPCGRGLHALVNNAGIYESMSLLMAEWVNVDDYKRLMDVNLYGMVRVTNKFVPLVRTERGRIVNMSSVSGRVGAGGAPYVCSKYAVEGYSDTLRQEFYHAGIKVSIIEPSGYQTDIINVAEMKEKLHTYFNALDDDIKEHYGKDYPEEIIGSMKDKYAISGRLYEVVDAYEHAVTAKYPQGRYVVGKDSNTLFRILWHAPEWFTAYFLGKANWPIPKALRHDRY